MFEFMGLAYAAAISLGLIGLDSFLSADTARIQVLAHPGAQTAGYQQEISTQYFDHEVRRIFDSHSLMIPPRIRIQTSQSLISVLAQSAGVRGLQTAMQEFLGLDPLTIHLMVHAPAGAGQPARLQVFGRVSGAEVFDVDAVATPGDVPGSLREAAMQAALAIDPYYARLDQFRTVIDDRARQVGRVRAERGVSAEEALAIYLPTERTRLLALVTAIQHDSEDVPAYDRVRLGPLYNLVGAIRFAMGDRSDAEAAFRLASVHDQRLVAPHANLAMILLLDGNAAGAAIALELAHRVLHRAPVNRHAAEMLHQVLLTTAAMTAAQAGETAAALERWNQLCRGASHSKLVALYRDARWAPAEPARTCVTRLAEADRPDGSRDEDGMFGDPDDIAAELLLFTRTLPP